MLRWIRIVLKLAVFFAVLAVGFSLLMFAAKIWGVYTVPPSEKSPKGMTLIITRSEGEPLFNAPDRPRPEEVVVPQGATPGMFGGSGLRRKPIEQRIILRFPYMRWIHEKAKDTTFVFW